MIWAPYADGIQRIDIICVVSLYLLIDRYGSLAALQNKCSRMATISGKAVIHSLKIERPSPNVCFHR